jgi:mRNA degradation ribonuclease J1/J2
MVNFVTDGERNRLVNKAKRLLKAGYSVLLVESTLVEQDGISRGRARSYATKALRLIRGEQRKKR